MRTRGDRVARIAQTLNAVSPLQTVGRGYALLTATGTQQVVSRRSHLPADGRVTAQIVDGRLFCKVERSDRQGAEDLMGEAAAKRRTRRD